MSDKSWNEGMGSSTGSAVAEGALDVGALMSAVTASSSTPMMMIDRDFKIIWANQATHDLLGKHEEALRRVYRGFDAKHIMGASIDMFHANPAHQRRLLADPRNLPHRADIKVGALTFDINVTAVMDDSGTYVASALEWHDVTNLRAKEREVERLQSAIDGSTTALMLADEDFRISYLNTAVRSLLKNRQDSLRKIFPGFDVDQLVGRQIDEFHKNPAHQRGLLRDPARLPHRAELALLDLTFDLNLTAIKNAEGKIVGNAVEWRDVSQQKSAERAIESLIGSASEGRLEERIAVDELTGFMKNIASGVNRLLDTVVTPLREIGRVIDALADGSLTQRMDGEYAGEFDSLKQSLNTSMDRLLEVVTRISDSAGSVKSAAGEIASGNTHLQQRTEEQAQSLQETASSIEELTATVKQNADNARQANQLAASARENAEKGGDVVGRAVTSMSAINDASKKIADIIGVIDEIAFQTNLLALNAAVEAARAGEQGRGFAVVATEVRNLAQRSAEAAKQIKALINDSVEKVDQGTRLVDESGSTLKDIVQSVKRVSDIVAEISAASDEQASGIEQINKAVVQMDEVTQQNAAQVEQVAAAAESLQQQAEDLDGMVGTFDVGHTGESSGGRASSEPEPARKPVPAKAPAKAPAPAAKKPAAAPARPASSASSRPGSSSPSKSPAPAPRRPSPSKGEGDDWKEF